MHIESSKKKNVFLLLDAPFACIPAPWARPAACALIPVTNLSPPPPSHGGSLPQPLLFNTLQVRSALGAAQRRKLSFKNVSNVVVQLLHSIKYSMEVPFSNMALQTDTKSTNTRKVSFYLVKGGMKGFLLRVKWEFLSNLILCRLRTLI